VQTVQFKYYWLTVGVLVLDHLTKWLVRSRMGLYETIELIPGYLRLSHVQNTGVAFGLLNDLHSVWKPYFLAGMAVLAAVVIAAYASRVPAGRSMLQTALAVTMGGILGNFVDRLAFGYVTDFVEFHIKGSFHWPTFNVADTAISVGIGLLLLDTIKNPDPSNKPADTGAERADALQAPADGPGDSPGGTS
jgi:signal peptidase II